jgi:hypothetical protein
MRQILHALHALLLCMVVGYPLNAFETDQFMAWEHRLEDSTDRFNAYVNQQSAVVLEQINRSVRTEVTCEEIPVRIYRHLYSSIFWPRVRRFLTTDTAVDRFPDRQIGYFGYLKRSVFRKPAFPYILPMARTIRINGVNLGIDKVGHMFGFGRRYYGRYRRLRRRGLDEQEAMGRVIVWGYKMEHIAVGGLTDGVVSHGDLEANFQGMRLARDLCEAQPPFLVRSSSGWRLARPIDLRDYVNPRFDETYNPSLFTRGRWKKVKPILESEYCQKFRGSAVQALMADYRQRDFPSFASEVIERHAAERGHTARRQLQSLEVLCPGGDILASSFVSVSTK